MNLFILQHADKWNKRTKLTGACGSFEVYGWQTFQVFASFPSSAWFSRCRLCSGSTYPLTRLTTWRSEKWWSQRESNPRSALIRCARFIRPSVLPVTLQDQNGAPTESRTRNLQLKRMLLYHWAIGANRSNHMLYEAFKFYSSQRYPTSHCFRKETITFEGITTLWFFSSTYHMSESFNRPKVAG